MAEIKVKIRFQGWQILRFKSDLEYGSFCDSSGYFGRKRNVKFLLTFVLYICYLNFHLIVCAYIHYRLLRYRKLYFLLYACIFLLTMSLTLQCICNMLSLNSFKITQHIEFPLIHSISLLILCEKRKKDPFLWLGKAVRLKGRLPCLRIKSITNPPYNSILEH